ncbi:hypothetical protein D3C87_1363240 [compost metagenome]
MQQRRVVRILEVLVVHLPVAGKLVAAVAQDLEFLAREGNVELLDDLLGHVLFQGRGLVGVGGEHHAVARGHAQLAGAVVSVLEVRRHATDLVDAALERNALQVSLEVVRPLVVGADELLRIALAGATELSAAMGAAVLEDGDRVVLRANDHDGRGADVTALVVARVGNLRFQGDKVPGVPPKDALDLLVIDRLAGVDPVRNVVHGVRWPDALFQGRVLSGIRDADDRLRLIHESSLALREVV